MQANALQFDFFGQHVPLFLRAIPKKSSIEDVCNIISNKVSVETVAAQVEAVQFIPKRIFGIDVEHPTNLFERILADQVKTLYAKPVAPISASNDEEKETLQSSEVDEDEEEGSGVVGVHKKILTMSLKDLQFYKINGIKKRGTSIHNVHEICMWIMDGNDQARPFSFDACCALCEIDPDSLRDNLMAARLIPHRFLH